MGRKGRTDAKLSVAIIGTRGYPSYYGGFETAVRKIAPFLAAQDWEVSVYGRRSEVRLDDADRDTRVEFRPHAGYQLELAKYP